MCTLRNADWAAHSAGCNYVRDPARKDQKCSLGSCADSCGIPADASQVSVDSGLAGVRQGNVGSPESPYGC